MKNQEIYAAALRLISQVDTDPENDDYEDRASYIIASFCTDVADIDSLSRKVLGLKERNGFNAVWISLDDDFPLLDKFASVGAKYLASMLVIDEKSDLSEKLYEQYCDGISRIRSELPCSLESIKNKYPD